MTIRWGILGPGRIAEAFATGLAAIESGNLVAIGSRERERSLAFGQRYNVAAEHCHGSYDALVADDAVDAIYVATPHPWHLEHGLLVLSAGKHLLCEKPAGMTASDVTSLVRASRKHQRFFMEAFMYRSHPLTHRICALLADDVIGTPLHVDASFGFATTRDATSRLFAPALGGGGILDVGCYPVSFARLVAGVAAGVAIAEPVSLIADGVIGPTEVDEEAHAMLRFEGGMTASIRCALTCNLGSHIHVRGSTGSLRVERDCWIPGGAEVAAGRSTVGDKPDAVIVIEADDGPTRREELPHRLPLYGYEAEAASLAMAAGQREGTTPAPSHRDSLGNAAVLDAWRDALRERAAGAQRA